MFHYVFGIALKQGLFMNKHSFRWINGTHLLFSLLLFWVWIKHKERGLTIKIITHLTICNINLKPYIIDHFMDFLFLLKQIQWEEIVKEYNLLLAQTLLHKLATIRSTNPFHLEHHEVGIHWKSNSAICDFFTWNHHSINHPIDGYKIFENKLGGLFQ